MNKYDVAALVIIIAIPLIAGVAFIMVANALADLADKTKSSD